MNDGPTSKIPISYLQSNAIVVNFAQNNNIKSKRITNIIHFRFHSSDGTFATIKALDLWHDVEVIHGTDFVYTSCKIMSIPTSSRG